MKGNVVDLSLLPCQSLKGVGKQIAEKLTRLNVNCVQDLLFHLPFRYQDRSQITPLRAVKPGDHVVIEGEIATVSLPKGGRTRLLCKLFDATSQIQIRFFYMNAVQLKTFKPGGRLRCFGEIRFGNLGLEMIHPECRIIVPGMELPTPKTLTPIYPTTEGLSQLFWRKMTEQALALLSSGGLLQEVMPPAILETLTFPTLKEALTFVHRPPLNAAIPLLSEGKHVAQKRLVFEELLAHRLSLLHLKNEFQIQKAPVLLKKETLEKKFYENLPFKLTSAQERVIKEIYSDIALSRPMLRLVQGDVGSGKTVVAALGILQAVENGYQGAVLAPTEILAEQHYQQFRRWFISLGIHVVLLSGQMKTAARREALDAIRSGLAKVVIGTHAIFQKEVEFSKLGFIVVDEQHRFGVMQRSLLREKGVNADYAPHQLIMTATPIPRTLAMSVYADLDYSVIDELPPGRTPIKTSVVSNKRREEVLTRIRDACLQGRQVYWVCTLIAESELMQCQAAENTFELLNQALPNIQIALLHGRMKSDEKEQVMAAFKRGDIQLLVATTVIEVGVDVPNASLMVIENAERLGLAQLHQLRGRVGRGALDSYCLLLYQDPLSRFAKERLSVMRETTDGFKIAQKDLEIRGPGEVLGTKQTGDISLRIADLMRDSDLLPAVQEVATILQKDYPEKIPALIQRWIGNNARFGHV